MSKIPNFYLLSFYSIILQLRECQAKTEPICQAKVHDQNFTIESGPRSKAHGTTLFIVEEGMPGFHKGKNLKKMGLKGQDTAELFFEDVRVPKANMLGGENKGFYQLMKELPQERLGEW